MRFLFTTEQTVRRTDEIVSYLLSPRLFIPRADYPDIEDWAQRAWQDLRKERKRPVLCLSSGSLVGAAVYQRHREEQGTLELKNLTVRPDARGRHVASFLLRNAEIEGRSDFGSVRIVADAKARNLEVRAFLLSQGYLPDSVRDLTGSGRGRRPVPEGPFLNVASPSLHDLLLIRHRHCWELARDAGGRVVDFCTKCGWASCVWHNGNVRRIWQVPEDCVDALSVRLSFFKVHHEWYVLLQEDDGTARADAWKCAQCFAVQPCAKGVRPSSLEDPVQVVVPGRGTFWGPPVVTDCDTMLVRTLMER